MKPIILFFKKPKKVSSRPVREMVLFFKAEVKGHFRRLASGKIVTVRPYWNKRGKEAKGNMGQDARMENALRNLVSAATYDAARTTLQQRTLPPAVVNAGLTEAEQVALHLWTLDTGKEAWFQQINRALRSGNEDDLQRLEPLIAAMRSGLAKLPPFVGVVYRAVKEKPFAAGEFSRYINRHQPGLEIVDVGFSGASQTLEQALRGRVKMIVESTDGKDISALSSKPDQQEILFTSGSRFLVTDRFDQTNQVIRLWLQQQPN